MWEQPASHPVGWFRAAASSQSTSSGSLGVCGCIYTPRRLTKAWAPCPLPLTQALLCPALDKGFWTDWLFPSREASLSSCPILEAELVLFSLIFNPARRLSHCGTAPAGCVVGSRIVPPPHSTHGMFNGGPFGHFHCFAYTCLLAGRIHHLSYYEKSPDLPPLQQIAVGLVFLLLHQIWCPDKQGS